MPNRVARIKSRSKGSDQALRVVQTDKGVFWDLEETTTGKRRFIISTRPSSARNLAQWILDNIDEEAK
jgi:hypothetical protein